MRIQNIQLQNFRSYENIIIHPVDGINVIHGNNGSGKTNIIEAIYWMSFGKSFRTSEDTVMVKHNSSSASVLIDADVSGLEKNFEISYNKEARRKNIRVNGTKVKKFSDIIGQIPVILFSPENIMTIKGEPTLRRKLIDDMLSQTDPEYYDLITRYAKEVSHRNYLLKGIKEGKLQRANLEVWNALITEKGINIIQKRIAMINSINRILKNELNAGSGDIELKYSSKHFSDFEPENMKSIFEKHFKDNIYEEITRGTTTIGPHKDDIEIFYNSMPAKLFASEGQQRITAILIKLAEGLALKEKKSAYPVVLLDDFSSELDDVNRGIIGKTFASFRQIIITTTSLSNLKGFKPQKEFHVEHFKVI